MNEDRALDAGAEPKTGGRGGETGDTEVATKVSPPRSKVTLWLALLVAPLLAVWIWFLARPYYDFERFNEQAGLEMTIPGLNAPDQWAPGKLRAGFLLINPDEILGGGPKKDGIATLTHPKTIAAEEADFLRQTDRVVGVVIGGEARAYPLRILIWHENANDTLGGRHIAVTYCPLCDSVMTIDREIGGQLREFGISGKLYRSNVLLYDRQDDPNDESLWSQLQMRAVAGPAAEAGLEFKLVESELTTWADWATRYPETTVLSLDTGYRRNYFLPPYQNYFMTDTIGYGAHGNPERRADLKNKDRIVVAQVGDERRIYVVKDVAKATADGRPLRDTLGGAALDISYLADADTVRIEPAHGETEVHRVYSFWFAWEELYPGVDIWSPK